MLVVSKIDLTLLNIHFPLLYASQITPIYLESVYSKLADYVETCLLFVWGRNCGILDNSEKNSLFRKNLLDRKIAEEK